MPSQPCTTTEPTSDPSPTDAPVEEPTAEPEPEAEAEVMEETMQEEAMEEEMAPTIAEIATEAGGFDTLLAALTAADLAGAFADAEAGPFTVFAPTDDAFTALPEGTLETLLADPEGALTNILTYHVIEGAVMAETVVTLEMATTLNGSDIQIAVIDGGVVLNDTVNIIITDLEANNGVIHVIDTVLIPAE